MEFPWRARLADADRATRILALRSSSPPETFRYSLEDPIEEKLPSVRVPALVVRGSWDPVVTQSWAEEVADLLPMGRLVVIPDGPHTLVHNRPLDLARVVRHFLSSAPVQSFDVWHGLRGEFRPSAAIHAQRASPGSLMLDGYQGWSPSKTRSRNHRDEGRLKSCKRLFSGYALARRR